MRGDDIKDEIEVRWRDLGEFIREQRRVTELSLRKLSERAGVSNPYLSQIERGMRRPSAEILRQIARALEISSEELYVRAGILDERTDAPDVIGEIRRDPLLSEDQKKTLIHIYGSFIPDLPAKEEPGESPALPEVADATDGADTEATDAADDESPDDGAEPGNDVPQADEPGPLQELDAEAS